MRIKILRHNIILTVESFDKDTQIATVKMFGAMCDFHEHEYKIIKEK